MSIFEYNEEEELKKFGKPKYRNGKAEAYTVNHKCQRIF